MNTFIKATIATLAISVLSGCGIPMADKVKDEQAKKFEITSLEKVPVYVVRDEAFGGYYEFKVSVDDVYVGKTIAKTFIKFDVSPGLHKLKSEAENTEELEFMAKSGRPVYIWQEAKFGIVKARNKISIIDEKEGKERVLKSELAE